MNLFDIVDDNNLEIMRSCVEDIINKIDEFMVDDSPCIEGDSYVLLLTLNLINDLNKGDFYIL